MATYSVTDNGIAVAAGAKPYMQEVVLDFSTTNLGIGEDIDALQVPANTLVLCVGIELVTASSNAGTIDVGDGTAPDTWVTDLDADGAVGIQETGAASKFYLAADVIDVKAITAIMDGKVRVFAVMVPMNAAGTAASFA
jgi:predicted secreted protein